MRCLNWLCSIRSSTIFMTVAFVLVASLSTASILWRSGEDAVLVLGERIVTGVIGYVEQIVLSALGDVAALSIQGSMMASKSAVDNGNGTLSWQAIWNTSVFQLGTVKTFDLVVSSGLLHTHHEWLLIEKPTKGEVPEYIVTQMPCQHCNATAFLVGGDNYTEVLYPTNHLMTKRRNLTQEWKKEGLSLKLGNQSSWGITHWVGGQLERVFVTLVIVNGVVIGTDFKGFNMLGLQPYLHE
eukprot:TRINITY_DN17183_c0_g1_i1.p1 TRINITY_DN17183_c0_g1~~TRINITY_DN17183_c0_g1_i1.p1  ORF type:complete len:240 (+),score=27.66 TRINITY_DN17183_c0_g1_i1:69-788(+)